MRPFLSGSNNPRMVSSMEIPSLPTIEGNALIIEGRMQALQPGVYPSAYENNGDHITLLFCFSNSQFKMYDKNGHWLQWGIDPKYTWDSVYNWKLAFDGITGLYFYLDDVEQQFVTMSEEPLIFNGFSEKVNIICGDGIIAFKEII